MGKGREVFNLFKKHLTANDFHYEADDNRLVIRMTVHGDDLPQPTIIHVFDDRDVVQIISPIPGNMPEEKRPDAAVAVAVANYGMINGCFDLDMSDGMIHFRLAQGFHGITMSEDLVHYMLSLVFFTTDKYNDRFFMLGKGMMSLEKFIEKENED